MQMRSEMRHSQALDENRTFRPIRVDDLDGLAGRFFQYVETSAFGSMADAFNNSTQFLSDEDPKAMARQQRPDRVADAVSEKLTQTKRKSRKANAFRTGPRAGARPSSGCVRAAHELLLLRRTRSGSTASRSSIRKM